jgi:hypothetical protein
MGGVRKTTLLNPMLNHDLFSTGEWHVQAQVLGEPSCI